MKRIRNDDLIVEENKRGIAKDFPTNKIEKKIKICIAKLIKSINH